MSAIAISPSVAANSSASNAERKVDWTTFAWLSLAAVLASSIANALVYFAGNAVLGYDPAFVELGSALGIAICTAAPAVIASLLYATLVAKTERPARNFTIVSAAVFVLSLIPDVTMLPGEPGSSNAQIAVLMLMHAVAAAIIVRVLTTFPRE
jgi:hypothetical protein